MPTANNSYHQKGAVPVLGLFAFIGLISFLLISNTFGFKDRLFNNLFPKPSSFAQSNVVVVDNLGNPLDQTISPVVKVKLFAPSWSAKTTSNENSLIKEAQARSHKIRVPTLTAPQISTISCINSAYTGSGVTISWVNPSTPVSFVDISSDSAFRTFYNKYVNGLSSTTAPNGFNLYNGTGSLNLSPATTYFVRLYNGSHSTATSFSIPACQTSTPSPTAQPTIAPTPKPTPTPIPTLSPTVAPTAWPTATPTPSTPAESTIAVQLSEDGINFSAPLSFSGDSIVTTFNLSAPGDKTVYAKFTSSLGNVSAVYQSGKIRYLAGSTIYDDQVNSAWQNWPYNGTANPQDSSITPQTGTAGYSFQATSAWGAIQFGNGSQNTSGFDTLTLAVYPTQTDQPIAIFLNNGSLPKVALSKYGPLTAGVWKVINIPLSDLGANNTTINNIQIQDWTGLATGGSKFLIDNLAFVNLGLNTSSPTPTPTPIIVATPPPPPPPPPPTPPPGTLPALKTSGNKIVTPGGNVVVLRGANILRSEWDLSMWWETKAIPEMAKNWKGNVVLRGFASDPIVNPNFSWTSSWGVTVNQATYLSWLDQTQALAEANKMYVIFVFRSAAINGPQPALADAKAQQALNILAARYKNKTNVMYGLQVEPHDVSWDQAQPTFQSMVNSIRSAASPSKPIIMVPGTNWGRDVSGAITKPVTGENIVYKSHMYNCASYYNNYFMNTYNAGLPVFIGEFGSDTSSGCGPSDMSIIDINSLMTLTRNNSIGWAAWIFDFAGPPVLLQDSNMTPASPYGTTIKAEMLNTPPIPSN